MTIRCALVSITLFVVGCAVDDPELGSSEQAINSYDYSTTGAPFGYHDCNATAVDFYGRPMAGMTVTLTTWYDASSIGNIDYSHCGPDYSMPSGYGYYKTRCSFPGVTDSDGRAFIRATNPYVYNSYGSVFATVQCTVSDPTGQNAPSIGGTGFMPYNYNPGYPLATSSVTALMAPRPTYNYNLPGLVNTAGACTASNQQCAHLDFYMGNDGVYNKVVVLVEPIETSLVKRTAAKMWLQYNGNPYLIQPDTQQPKGILRQLYDQGVDVWIVRSADTGQNLWEQAAETAQAIQYAATRSPYGAAANGKVATFGFSLAGLVLRIALTRWDYDSADPASAKDAWRRAVGNAAGFPLAYPLPVSILATGDAPLRGAQANEDFQDVAWREQGGAQFRDKRLDSCSAHQMLQWGRDATGFNSTGWNAFFTQGTSFTVIDSIFPAPKTRVCDGGPPALTQGRLGNGWPAGIRKIGFSQGKKGEQQQCYGDSTGHDKDVLGADICVKSNTLMPVAGTQAIWIKKTVDYLPDGFSKDWHIYYKRTYPNQFRDDLESGSKHDAIFNTTMYGGAYYVFTGSAIFYQYGPVGTFIPLRSALDRTCDPGISSCAQSLDAEWTNTYNASHQRLEKPQVDWMLAEVFAALDGTSPPAAANTCEARGQVGVGNSNASNAGLYDYYCGYYYYNGYGWDYAGYCSAAGNYAQSAGIATTATGQCSGGAYYNYQAGLYDYYCRYYEYNGYGWDYLGYCTAASSYAQQGGCTSCAGAPPPPQQTGCGEASCVAPQGAYISHYTGLGCTGTESYYLPYDGYGYSCRPWNGTGQCGSVHRTVTNKSARLSDGSCSDYWPDGNTLSDFVTVYR